MSMSSNLKVPAASGSNLPPSAMETMTYTPDRRGRGPLSQPGDESLIVDDRSAMSPAQAVENRLSRLLANASMPVSHLQMRGMLLRRS